MNSRTINLNSVLAGVSREYVLSWEGFFEQLSEATPEGLRLYAMKIVNVILEENSLLSKAVHTKSRADGKE